jgi:hypothetical protein
MGYYVADNMNTESSVKAQYGYKTEKEQWNTIDSSFRQRIAILCDDYKTLNKNGILPSMTQNSDP